MFRALALRQGRKFLLFPFLLWWRASARNVSYCLPHGVYYPNQHSVDTPVCLHQVVCVMISRATVNERYWLLLFSELVTYLRKSRSNEQIGAETDLSRSWSPRCWARPGPAVGRTGTGSGCWSCGPRWNAWSALPSSSGTRRNIEVVKYREFFGPSASCITVSDTGSEISFEVGHGIFELTMSPCDVWTLVSLNSYIIKMNEKKVSALQL